MYVEGIAVIISLFFFFNWDGMARRIPLSRIVALNFIGRIGLISPVIY